MAGDLRLGLFALDDIDAGTELTFDYRLDFSASRHKRGPKGSPARAKGPLERGNKLLAPCQQLAKGPSMAQVSGPSMAQVPGPSMAQVPRMQRLWRKGC